MVKIDATPFPLKTTWFPAPPQPNPSPCAVTIQVLKQYAADIWISLPEQMQPACILYQ